MVTATVVRDPQLAQAPTEALVAEVLARKDDLTDDQRFDFVAAALGLCAACRAEFKRWMPGAGYNLVRMVREHLWEWRGLWQHANACPPEGSAQPDGTEQPIPQ